MITKKMLEEKLIESGIECNILAFQNAEDDESFAPHEFWFAFSFDENHTTMEDPLFISDGEDDYLGGIVVDTDQFAEKDNLLDAVGYVRERYQEYIKHGYMVRG